MGIGVSYNFSFLHKINYSFSLNPYSQTNWPYHLDLGIKPVDKFGP